MRGVFLQEQTSVENSHELRSPGLLSRWVSDVIGARNVNMMRRKREELRLSIWLEHEMGLAFGSKQRAKEEIFARYASFVYMGHGQYGFARAAEYYFGRSLSTFTVDDADKAATVRENDLRKSQISVTLAKLGEIAVNERADKEGNITRTLDIELYDKVGVLRLLAKASGLLDSPDDNEKPSVLGINVLSPDVVDAQQK